MAADHYKEKNQGMPEAPKSNKLSDQSANSNSVFTKKTGNQQKRQWCLHKHRPSYCWVYYRYKATPSAAETDSDGVTKGQVCDVTKETADKTEKYNKGKRLLRDEKTKFNKYVDELQTWS